LTMLLNFPDILLLLLIFQLLFTSIYLFSKKTGNPLSNNLLGFFFLVICISTGDSLLLRTGTWYSYPAFATLSSAFPFLYGPLLFLYTASLIYKNYAITKKRLLHFVPFALFFLMSAIGYEIQPTPQKISILRSINNHHLSLYFYTCSFLMVLHFIAYAIAALCLINKYKKLSLNKFSVQKNNLDWLSSTIIFFLIIFVIALINNAFEFSAMSKLYPVSLLIIILLLFYFINRVLFKALIYPEQFSLLENNEDPIKIKKGVVQQLPDKSAELKLLTDYMEQHKPYLNADLTIEVLARSMRLQSKELSTLINEYLKQNFFDFINRYRIDEARRLLSNNPDKKITVLEILYKTGFNSKSSFNTLFKKYTGVTPTEFKAQNS
ncbi:MAG: helix-turn-helix domain-containing protein, partial [Mucilaginibacter sp.]